MEAQENDLPQSVPFRIAGFPTLKFKPAGSRDFIDYEGDRSYESLIAFIEEHAKNSLDLPEVVEEPAQTPLADAPEPTASVTATSEPAAESAHDEL